MSLYVLSEINSRLQMKINLNTAIYRVSFHITIIMIALALLFSITAGITAVTFGLSNASRDFLIIGAVFSAIYVAIRFFLEGKLGKEMLVTAEMTRDGLKKAKPGFYLTWGYIWRWLILSIVLNFITGSIHSYTNSSRGDIFSNPIDIVVWFTGAFFAAVWLFRQPYGAQRILPQDDLSWQITEIESSSFKGGAMFNKLAGLAGGALGVVAIGFYILFGIGGLYWLWMSIQLGSFLMFVIGIIPPFFILTSIIGGYSLIFGLPEWVYNWFG
jgi:hypothetical protein